MLSVSAVFETGNRTHEGALSIVEEVGLLDQDARRCIDVRTALSHLGELYKRPNPRFQLRKNTIGGRFVVCGERRPDVDRIAARYDCVPELPHVASAKLLNICSFRHSSRNRPLKLSTTRLSCCRFDGHRD